MKEQQTDWPIDRWIRQSGAKINPFASEPPPDDPPPEPPPPPTKPPTK